MDLGIRGRVAIVTGGSKGIGFAIAEALAREGARVLICARDAHGLERAAERLRATGEVAIEAADVRHNADCERIVDACRRAFGKVDVLVNNAAATAGGPAGFLALRDEDWLATYEGSLLSAVRLSRLVLPEMAQRKWGRIVMIASTSGRQPDVVVPHYNAAKAGMINLSKTLANAFAADQVLVNCVCPGLVRTAALEASARRRLEEQGTDTREMSDDDVVARYYGPRRPIPLGRVGRPADVAGLVALLCSEQAAWITGACIDVDGGWVRSIL
jgi:NAD(P)-dependent dehydrogenase (short-subunit alcohol dehydrogenase family)